MKALSIGHKYVGKGKPAWIIAEMGSNHNQSLSQTNKLIQVAAQAGADAVKIQLFKAANLYKPKDALFQVFKENEFPYEWVMDCKKEIEGHGMTFLATPFDVESVDFLDSVGVSAYKWASSELTKLALLSRAASKGKPLLLSTGMSNLADIYEALQAAYQSGNQQIALLQCTSLYPTSVGDAHLRVMDTLRDAFDIPVGFSDHTLGILAPVAAVARGACIIEKHFTLDRTLKGPDHFYAIEPTELKQMISDIRSVEKMLGSREKEILSEEKKQARKNSLHANQDIEEGVELSDQMMSAQRPAHGIDPRFRTMVIGRKIKRPLKKGDPITWNEIR